MSDNRPIGVFDSGVGGLSVLREIRTLLPQESLLYCADSGYAPYGMREQEEVIARAVAIAQFLLEHQAKAIVVACNTATVAAARALRERWPQIPIIAMEPAVKPAALATRTGIVGVLATAGTLASSQFAALLDNFGRGIQVVTQPGIGLVECVERGALDTDATRNLLRRHLCPMLDADADVIVLGCTHYVFLRELIEDIVGPQITLIDTGKAVAQQLQRRLAAAQSLSDATAITPTRFWSSGELVQATDVFRRLWQQSVDLEMLGV